MPRHLLPPLVVMVLLFVPLAAHGAPGDAAAEQKINEAVNQHYFNTAFDQAEKALLAGVEGCGKGCSGTVLGRLWMYVGMVRVNGKDDRAGAVQAFRNALAVDPNVALDETLVTPAATNAFKEAGSGRQTGAAAAPPAPAAAAEAAPEAPAAPAGPAGPLACVPEPRDVSRGQSIPFSCTTDKPAMAGTLYFMEPNGTEWAAVNLRRKDGALQGVVPCRAVAYEGTLKIYIELRDARAKVVDTFASKTHPLEYSIVKSSPLPAPSLPGEPPPPRCRASELRKKAPVRGTKDWGDACEADHECKSALCVQGACDACNADSDCPSGSCSDGACTLVESDARQGGDGDRAESAGAGKQNWFGIHGALDLVMVGGDNVCTRENQSNNGYACFYQGYSNQYVFDPYPGYGGKVPSGLALASKRVLVSYDRVVSPKVTLGARLGFASGDRAPEGAKTGVPLSPLHAELRLGYWLTQDPFSGTGLRPYLHLGAGMATVHAKSSVQIYDCQGGVEGVEVNGQLVGGYDQPTGDGYEACATGEVPASTEAGIADIYLDAFKTMGQFFLTAGGGVVYAFSPTFGMQLNVNLMLFVPTSGFGIEPSLGPVMGF